MPTLTLESLLLFLFFVAPGFFAMQVYSLWHPGHKREWGNAWMEVISYSLAIFLLYSWWIVRLIQPGYAAANPVELAVAGILVCFVSPVLLALLVSWLRLHILPGRFGADHPTRTGWDHYLKRHRTFFALFHLKTGEMIGGLYAGESYASTFPVDQEMYLEQVWKVDEQGCFQHPIPGTLGILIRMSECSKVEFFTVEVTTNVGQQGQATLCATGQTTSGGTAGASNPGQADPGGTPGSITNGLQPAGAK